MKKHEFIEFEKRYEKFQKNNLPTPFFDDERQTFEYDSISTYWNFFTILIISLIKIAKNIQKLILYSPMH